MFSDVHGRSILKRNFTDRDSKCPNRNRHTLAGSLLITFYGLWNASYFIHFKFFLSTIDTCFHAFRKNAVNLMTLLQCFYDLRLDFIRTNCSDAERFAVVVSCDAYDCLKSLFVHTIQPYIGIVRFIIMLVNRSDFYPQLDKLYSNCIWHFLLNMLVRDVYQCHKCFSDSYPFGYKKALFACKLITTSAFSHFHC